LVHFVGGG